MAKVEGKGNGIKTVIANMAEIGKALNRPPTYPTKYFGCELGAQTQFDFKNDRFIVNGDHDSSKLQDILDGFIRKFVLCPGCDNPETIIIVKKNQIFQTCKACGYAGTISQKQKLATFILKNPPPVEEDLLKKAKKIQKNGKKEGSGSPEQNGKENVGFDFDHHENGVDRGSDDFDDDDWADDDSTRKLELTGAMAALAMNPDLDRPIEERLDMFYNYLMKAKTEANGNALNSKAVFSEAERLDVKDKAALLLCRAIFDDNVTDQIETHRNTLLRFCNENPKAQRYFLGGIEQLLVSEDHKMALLPKTARILHTLYEKDILDEELMMEWGKKPSKKYVTRDESREILAKAEPFLNWLKEAEEETSDEESEEEVEFGDEKKPVQNSKPPSQPINKTEHHDDDFNIDDI